MKYTETFNGVSITVDDATDEILKALEKAKKRALEAIGLTAEAHAKEYETAVDTGRARNSITYATVDRQNMDFTYSDDSGKQFTENIGSGAEKDSVYIGSNVEYFPIIEYGGPHMVARHALQKSATQHSAEYKELTKKSLENA